MPDSRQGGYQVEAEIFSVGEWNGEKFTLRDLEEIARNFEALKSLLRPPLKFGHDENQTLLAQRDGDPALGWVERLRVRSGKLLATFSGMPEVVYEAIRKGRYRRVSAELYFNVRRGGRTLGKVLKAVALLGADLPAVTNLRELGAYLSAARPESIGAETLRVFSWPAGTITPKPTFSEDTPMPDLELPQHIQAELAELRAFRDNQELEQARELEKRKQDAFRSSRESAIAFAEEQVSEGRLSPRLSQQLIKEIDGQARTFTEGDMLRIPFSWVKAFVAESARYLPQGETAFAQGEPAAAPHGSEDPSQTLARLATDKMNELKLSYSEAAEYILRSHPELARAYREFTLNPNA